MSATVCFTLVACVDDKYDLTDIDTTTRVTVNNLTVPVNLQSIKLDDVIHMDDNDNIKTLTDANGQKYYAMQKDGDINTSDFNTGSIHVASIPINSLEYNIIPPYNSAPHRRAVAFDVNLPENLPMASYHINMDNIDPSILSIKDVKSVNPINLEVALSVNREFLGGDNKVVFKNVRIKLPWGLLTNDTRYDAASGIIEVNEIPVQSDGYARFSFSAYGINLEGKAEMKNHSLNISDEIGLLSAMISFNINTADHTHDMIKVTADFNISEFDIATVSGQIDYHMADVNIAPISLSDLPDFLNNPDTEIGIADPNINVDINNPIGRYGIVGSGTLHLTSNFDGNTVTDAQSDTFPIGTEGANLVFGTGASSGEYVHVDGLSDILKNPNAGGLPTSISVKVENLRFTGNAVDFPLGKIDSAHGDYTFTAPLGFAKGSFITYEDTENGWGSEDLDKVFIQHIHLKAICSTNLPVGFTLKVIPLDREGNPIKVKEDSSQFYVEPYSNGKEVSLSIEGADGPITNLDGITFKATITQDSDNTDAIGPDQFIELNDLRINVDGYYETDF